MRSRHSEQELSNTYDGRPWPQQTSAQKRGAACCAPFAGGGELSLRLTQCGLGWGLLPYQVASSSIHPFSHNRHGPKTGAVNLFRQGRGELGPHLTQRRWAEAYLCTKWHLDPSSRLATIDMNRKLVGSAPLLGDGELGPHLTQCRLDWGLAPYQVASWSIQKLGHNRYGPKIGCPPPFGGVGAGSPSNIMLPGLRPTCMPSSILIRPTV